MKKLNNEQAKAVIYMKAAKHRMLDLLDGHSPMYAVAAIFGADKEVKGSGAAAAPMMSDMIQTFAELLGGPHKTGEDVQTDIVMALDSLAGDLKDPDRAKEDESAPEDRFIMAAIAAMASIEALMIANIEGVREREAIYDALTEAEKDGATRAELMALIEDAGGVTINTYTDTVGSDEEE